MFKRWLMALVLGLALFVGGLSVAAPASANTVWLNADICDNINNWCVVYACSTRALASPVANVQEYFHGYYSSSYVNVNNPSGAECDYAIFYVDSMTNLIQIVVDCGGINCYSVWVTRYY